MKYFADLGEGLPSSFLHLCDLMYRGIPSLIGSEAAQQNKQDCCEAGQGGK